MAKCLQGGHSSRGMVFGLGALWACVTWGGHLAGMALTGQQGCACGAPRTRQTLCGQQCFLTP